MTWEQFESQLNNPIMEATDLTLQCLNDALPSWPNSFGSIPGILQVAGSQCDRGGEQPPKHQGLKTCGLLAEIACSETEAACLPRNRFLHLSKEARNTHTHTHTHTDKPEH